MGRWIKKWSWVVSERPTQVITPEFRFQNLNNQAMRFFIPHLAALPAYDHSLENSSLAVLRAEVALRKSLQKELQDVATEDNWILVNPLPTNVTTVGGAEFEVYGIDQDKFYAKYPTEFAIGELIRKVSGNA